MSHLLCKRPELSSAHPDACCLALPLYNECEGTSHGFLCVQERLKQQKEEANTNPDYDKSFKGQLSKEEKKAKRKQILSNIGANALASAFLPSWGGIL